MPSGLGEMLEYRSDEGARHGVVHVEVLLFLECQAHRCQTFTDCILYVCKITPYGVFNLTPSIVFRGVDSTSPLHVGERSGEMFEIE